MTRVERHSVSILGQTLSCSCERLRLFEVAWGPNTVRALAHSHIAHPTLTVEQLLILVGEP